MTSQRKPYSLTDLLRLMSRLRDPQSGCPWDLKQDFLSITHSTLEEVYEVVDAIEREDFNQLREELGDLLFQVVFYAQLAQEQQKFNFSEIVDAITEKLLRRHPHVFPNGNLTDTRKTDTQLSETKIKQNWEETKQAEREQKGRLGTLDDIPLALPALMRAAKLQKRASRVGFDWQQASAIIKKIEEEMGELKAEMETALVDREKIQNELGDVIFTCVNLVRFMAFDPEQTLRRANQKFEGRFRDMEARFAAEGKCIEDATAEEMDSYWERAKSEEH